MNEEARKLWKTPAGGSLMAKMLSGEPMAPEDRELLDNMKALDPPKMAAKAHPPATDAQDTLDGITLAGYHIERGARTFAAYARAMIEDQGGWVRPHLKGWYMAVKYGPHGAEFYGLSTAQQVETADLDNLQAPDAESGQPLLEPDRPGDQEPRMAQTNGDEKRANGLRDGPAGCKHGSEVDRASNHEQANWRAIGGLVESIRPLNRRQSLILVIVLTIIVGVPAWFFRFQPLPTVALGAFINRWTGTIYVVGANGQYVIAKPRDDSDR